MRRTTSRRMVDTPKDPRAGLNAGRRPNNSRVRARPVALIQTTTEKNDERIKERTDVEAS